MTKKRTRKVRTKRRSAPPKPKNGQYVWKSRDMRLRRLRIPTPQGVRIVLIRGFEQASRLGKYWNAVQKFLQTGDDFALQKFKGKTFTDASGNRYLFPTDLKQLDREASAGVLSFESMYAERGR